ncbi:MAG: YciI family protein [Alphaproteobacteria bacterium]|nr:YciI family protein [Alphaproteobacteria bacterium]MCZ6588158.1 YciI family protein [Alphaproteobacteria bacterium]
MLFAIVRKDKPGMADVRARLLSVHAEYQKAFMPMIVFGGGLVVDGTDVEKFEYNETGIRDVVGNVLILDVPDRATAEAMHRDDPYTKGGVFETVIIEPFLQRVPLPD